MPFATLCWRAGASQRQKEASDTGAVLMNNRMGNKQMPYVVTQDYHGHEISLINNNLFMVGGPLLADRTFMSYREATDAIDGAIKLSEKQVGTKLSIPMLNDAGEDVTITGIHAIRGRVLGCGDADYLYPRAEWIKKALLEKRRIFQQLSVIDRRLSPMLIKTRRIYGTMGLDQYNEVVSELTEEISRKTTIASDGE